MNASELTYILVSVVFGVFAGAAIVWAWTRQANKEHVATLNAQIEKLNGSLEAERLSGKTDAQKLQAQLSSEIEKRSRFESQLAQADRIREDAIAAKQRAVDEQLRLKDDSHNKLIAEKDRTIELQRQNRANAEWELREHYEAQLRQAEQAKLTALSDKDRSVAEQIRIQAASHALLIAEKDESIRKQLVEKQASIDEQKRLLAEAEKKLADTFESLSKKTLTSATDEFLKLATSKLQTEEAEANAQFEKRQRSIDEVVKPLKETLDKLDERQREMEEKRLSAYDGISGQIENLLKETGSLSNALRRPAIRGSWGEITLRTVADNAGLIEGQDYELQQSFNVEEGRLRPDMIVRLPNKRALVIDSKVPMDAYREAVAATTDEERRLHLDRHCRVIREHIKNLASKAYWNQIEGTDYVLMFLPTEAMYQAAIEHDADLINYALGMRVIPANPLTLVCSLKSVAYVLDISRLNQNAAEIKNLGQKLYDGVRVLGEHFHGIGKHLKGSVEAYNSAIGSLESNVLSKARQLKEKGVSTTKDVPEIGEVEVSPRSFHTPELIHFAASDAPPLPAPEQTAAIPDVTLLSTNETAANLSPIESI
jgi:DNA recombination protein RmuC